MMRMEHRQSQVQTQQLVLTQKMQQALHVLQLSGIELEQYVQQELETNPFLEQVAVAPPPLPQAPAPTENADGIPAFDEPFDLDNYSQQWDLRRREGADLSRNPDLDSRRQYYEDSITQSESLRAHLLTQMRISAHDSEEYRIGERIIIGDIDDRGFFTGNTEDIAQELDVPQQTVDAVLEQIRRLEPTGVGARDLSDCLLMQIEVEYPDNEALKTLARDHLDELLRRQIPVIAKKMKITAERVEELKCLLGTLNPWPGREFSTAAPQYVTPDVLVEESDGEFVVSLTSDRSFNVTVNKEYQESTRHLATSPEEKEYIRSKIESANWLQRNIAQRQRTILRVGQAIVEAQREFMEKGVEFIRPLTLQNIADVLGLHESTIARTTRGKYMQTPQGLFELKYFFSPGLSKDNGDAQSSKSVQALIKNIIDAEDTRSPLSDQHIADKIKEVHGIQIARRTVTKYREAMGILKTSMRRSY